MAPKSIEPVLIGVKYEIDGTPKKGDSWSNHSSCLKRKALYFYFPLPPSFLCLPP